MRDGSPHRLPSPPHCHPEGTRPVGPGEGALYSAELSPFSPLPGAGCPRSGWRRGRGDFGEGLEMRTGNEGEAWREALPAIADRLREIGYDIASLQSGAPPGGSIVARRDLGDRAVVLAIDAGGRFRAEISWGVGEWPSRDEIAGVPVQVVDAVSRTVTVTGQLPGPEQVIPVVRGLGTIASWAGVAGSEAPPPPR